MKQIMFLFISLMLQLVLLLSACAPQSPGEATPTTSERAIPIPAFFEAIAANDAEAALALFTQDAMVVYSGRVTYKGQDRLRQMIQEEIDLDPGVVISNINQHADFFTCNSEVTINGETKSYYYEVRIAEDGKIVSWQIGPVFR